MLSAVCLQGQTIPKRSVFGSLDLDPHDFLVSPHNRQAVCHTAYKHQIVTIVYDVLQVAIPTAGKLNTSSGIATSTHSRTTASAFAEAAGQPSSSFTTPASAQTAQQQQQQGTQPSALPVTSPLGPYTLLPGYVSRPHALDPVHPLPSEPIARAVPLQCTGPSSGAWAPQQELIQSTGPCTLDASAGKPSQSDLWADLAAELKSAPISASAQLREAPSDARTANSEHSPTNPAQLAQQELITLDDHPGVHTRQAQPSMSEQKTGHDTADRPSPAVLKPVRQARRKRVAVDTLTAPATDESLPPQEQTPTQPRVHTRAGAAAKGRARSRAAGTAPTPAPQAAGSTDANDSPLEAEAASRADPARQAKNAAFKGSRALGLSRRLSSRMLTPQEVNVMAKLPLPPALQRLEEVLFPPVNAMYGFLMRQHIQVCAAAAMVASKCGRPLGVPSCPLTAPLPA